VGAKVPRVYRLTDERIYMDIADGKTLTHLQGEVYQGNPRTFGEGLAEVERLRKAAYDSDDGQAIGLLDVLTDNWDRNDGNWLMDAAGRPRAIDHGMAWDAAAVSGKRFGADYADQPPQFSIKTDRVGKVKVDQWTFAYGIPSPFTKDMWWINPKGEHAWTRNDFTKADMDRARRRLRALRADFEHLGRADWFDFMMRRFEAVAAHAGGDGDRLPI
jgi:hypothetical protein